MGVLLAGLGVALVWWIIIDVLWTTLAVGSGGGPITSRVSSGVWKTILRHHRCASSHHLLAIAGYSTIIISTLVWIFLTWAGWVLIFSASDRSLIFGDSKQQYSPC